MGEAESEHAARCRDEFYSNWEAYGRHLLPYILHILRNEADAADVTEQTLVNHVESMERREWRVEIVDIKAYLRQSARHRCLKLLKLRSRETPLENDGEEGARTNQVLEEMSMELNDPTPDIQEEIYKKELARRLPQAVISKLTDEEKELLSLHVGRNLGAREVAELLGKEVCYVRYQINKLKAKLRYRLGKFFE